MRKKKYLSNWLSNTSVAAIIVGGFQEMETWLRIIALSIAIIFFFLGLLLNKED